MTQTKTPEIDPNTTNGPMLASIINNNTSSELTSNSGVERPSYATEGTIWLDTSNSTEFVLYITDGANDYPIMWFNPSNGTVTRESLFWYGKWDGGLVPKNHMVTDNGWYGRANKDTTERLAPLPLGDPIFSMPDAPIWVEKSHTDVVYSGADITFTKSGWAQSIEVWVPELTSDTNYRIIVVDITNPDNPIARPIEEPVLAENGWAAVALSNAIVTTGTVWRIFVDALNSGGDTIVTGGWTRSGNDNNLNPPAQNWNQNNQYNVLRIDKTDLDSTDRTTELIGIQQGSTITIAETADASYSVSYYVSADPTDEGSAVVYNVSLDSEGASGEPRVGETTTITALVPVPQTTKYVEIVDHWLTNSVPYATIEGYLMLRGQPDQVVPNNAYGVRLEFQEAIVSEDYDIAAIYTGSSSGGGGGGGGGSEVTAGAGLTSTDAGDIRTINVGTGTGISVGADNIAIDKTYFDTLYLALNGKAADSNLLNGSVDSDAASGGTIVRRHPSGYIFCNYLNSTANVQTSIPSYWLIQNTDNYCRKVALSYSKGSSGYERLPSGIILQWGIVTLSNNENRQINFPIAYTTTNVRVMGNLNSSGTPNSPISTKATDCIPNNLTTTKFHLYAGYDQTYYGNGRHAWFSIGY